VIYIIVQQALLRNPILAGKSGHSFLTVFDALGTIESFERGSEGTLAQFTLFVVPMPMTGNLQVCYFRVLLLLLLLLLPLKLKIKVRRVDRDST
jgi:hypothetical protein